MRPLLVISRVAAAARIKRRLRREGGDLHKCRKTYRDIHYLGDFYTVDGRGLLDVTHVDLEDFAKFLGVLLPGEMVDEE